MAFDKLWKIVVFSIIGSILAYLLFAYFFNVGDLFWEGFIPTLFIPLILSSFVGNFILRTNKKLKEKNIIIREQAEMLKQENQLKTRLLSIISHDIRSPLGSLKSILDLSESSEMSSSKFDEFKSQISDRLRTTERVLENTLVWIKHQQSDVELHLSSIELNEFIQMKLDNFKNDAKEKNIHFSTNLQHTVEPKADKHMLQIILRNLISNAIKFTPEGGTIEIKTDNQDDYTSIYICDTGVGLDAEQVQKLSNYESLRSTKGTNSEKGFGIGLETALHLIKLNKAELKVSSELGKGSTFEVRLPITQ